jgi:hypothetical protein
MPLAQTSEAAQEVGWWGGNGESDKSARGAPDDWSRWH